MLLPAKNAEIPPHIQIRKSTRARRMALRLDAKARAFNLVIPQGVSLKKALRFAEEHEDWMREKLDALPALVPFAHGAVLPVFGQNTTVKVFYDFTLKRTSISLIGNELTVRTNKEDPAGRIARFLKAHARDRLTALAHSKAERIGKKIGSVSVRDTTSRWGSCSADGKISFSWRLIFAPPAAMDYVVAHEAAHLTHLNHSKAFWALCRDLSDDYLEGRHWMDNHGAELMRFG